MSLDTGAVSINSVGSGGLRAQFTLIIRPAEDENDARETATDSRKSKSESAYHMFATDISPEAVGFDPDRLPERAPKAHFHLLHHAKHI
ncbi:MAG: hypothetical protein IS632_00490 [Thaumarchaeota archaeon]|nr:hypothetical protein [Nitrososphaerota archaeon]